MRTTLLLMCRDDPSRSPRPNRLIRMLAQSGCLVDILSYAPSGELDVRDCFILSHPDRSALSKVLRLIRSAITMISWRLVGWSPEIVVWLNNWRRGLLGLNRRLAFKEYHLVIVQDLALLPSALSLTSSAKILFDAREFYPRQNEESFLFRFFEAPLRAYLCRRYLPQCDQLITVSQGLARAYEAEYGVRMAVIRSTPAYQTVAVRPTDPKQIRMVHHGAANTNRGIENMIDILKRLDARFTLDLYLVGSQRNIAKLEAMAAGCDRIRFCESVSYGEIIPMLSRYDIGFYYLEPKGFNVTFNLPNKYFEFIQARLAVAIGPSPDMAELTKEYQCGFIAEAFTKESMIKTLNALTPEEVDHAKKNSDIAAKDLCYEREGEKLMTVIKGLVGSADRVNDESVLLAGRQG